MRRTRQLLAGAWNYARPRIRWRSLIPVVLFGLAIAYSANQTAADNRHWHQAIAAQQRQAAAEQAAQQRQGEAIERKICTGFGSLAALKPPSGSPADNPSRAFDQRQHAILVGIGSDVGCGKSTTGGNR